MSTVKIYGYLGVLNCKEDLENNKAAILLKANELKLGSNVEWIEEEVKGRKYWDNSELEKLMQTIEAGDVIITSEVSRFGRKYMHVMQFLAECAKKQVKIYCTNSNIKMDNAAEYEKIIFAQTISGQIQGEHKSIKEKRRENKDAVQLGRKEGSTLDKDPENVQKVKEMLDKDVKIKGIAKELNCTTVTLRKFIREHKLKEFKKKEHKLINEPDVVLTEEQQEEIKKQLSSPEKIKYKQIAKKYDVTVRKLIYLIKVYKLRGPKQVEVMPEAEVEV